VAGLQRSLRGRDISMSVDRRGTSRISSRQYAWLLAAATAGTVAFWSWLAYAVIGVPIVWVVVFALTSGVLGSVSSLSGYRAWRATVLRQDARSGPHSSARRVPVGRIKWRSRPSVSTVGTLVPTTPDYQAQALRLSFIAQCGLWPLVMTIVFFAWRERTAALCCLGVTFVAVPLATWRIVREFRSRT
jgi:hypothetical protein